LKTPSRHSKGRKPKAEQSVEKVRLAQCHAVVIGAGAIGRAVATLLASLGVRHMSLYDPAIVTRKNMAQGFMDCDVGMAKVDAVANIAHQQNPRMELRMYRSRFRRTHLQKWSSGLKNAVFVCVDSMAARKSIWKQLKHDTQFLCDGRFGTEVIRVIASQQPATDTDYPSTLAVVPPSTYSCDLVTTNIAAVFMVAQFSRWLRRRSVISDQILNLLAQEITILDGNYR